MVSIHSHASNFTASRIVVRRGGHKLLDEVSLALSHGEVTAIVGPNGAGKSTLLKVMAGDISPDSGDVILNERILSKWTSKDISCCRAVLPQHSDLAFPFEAYEVILIGREPHLQGKERELDHHIAHLAMQAVDIQHLARRNYQELSGGEKQRVHLARVLAQVWPNEEGEKRNYLLLDEPTSSLDLAHQHSLMQTIRKLSSKGLGILVVLHDLNIAAQYADRIILMSKGQVVANDYPEVALHPDLLQEVFGIPMASLRHPEFHYPILIPLVSGLSPKDNSTHSNSNLEQAMDRSPF